jgi:dethiobiotin synthetase
MRLQERTTVEALKKRAGVPVLGPLAYDPTMRKGFRRAVARMTRTAAIAALARLVKAAVR